MAKTTSPCQNCGTSSRFRFCRSCLHPLGDWATCPLVGDHAKAYMSRYNLLMRLSTAAPVRSQRVKVRLPPKLREVVTCEHGVPGRCEPCIKQRRSVWQQQWRAANPDRVAEMRSRENEKRRGNRDSRAGDPYHGPCLCGRPLGSESDRAASSTCGDASCFKTHRARFHRKMLKQKDERYIRAQKAANRRRRARLKQVERVEYHDADIFDRDKWTCYLCGKKIPKTAKWPDTRSASIDHLIPISQLGADAPWNVRAVHYGCNSSKNTKAMNEQLMLIG
jgi:hypothetical protein